MKGRLSFIFFFSLIILSPWLLSSQEEGEDIRSLKEERSRTLRYGIDTALIALMEELKVEGEEGFNEEILAQAKQALNSNVAEAALELFSATQDRLAADWAMEILTDEDLYSVKLLAAAIRYLGEGTNDQGAQKIIGFLKHEDQGIAREAIIALGKTKDEKYAGVLLDLLQDGDFHEKLKTRVIESLGDLGALEAVPPLTEIVENPSEERAWRWRACQALGKIGAPESFGVLQKIFSDEDKVLRAYATEALGFYGGKEAEGLLRKALRDGSWDIRMRAVRQLGERGSVDSVNFLIYLAEEDPEMKIRTEAVEALGKIAVEPSLEFLGKLAASTKTQPNLWAEAVGVMVEKNLEGSLKSLIKIIDQEWEKKNSYFLNKIGIHLSRKKSKQLEGIFERFLGHPEIPIRLYGIRGVSLNGFVGLREKIEALTQDENPRIIRQNALDVLESLEHP